LDNIKSDKFLKEFNDKYITSAELETLIFNDDHSRQDNRMTLSRNKLHYLLRKKNRIVPNRIKIGSAYYLWDRNDALSYINNPNKEKEYKSNIFLEEFNDKYILVPEICKKLKTTRTNVFLKREDGKLPNGFQIPVAKYWIWVREDINPYLVTWGRSLNKKRKIDV